MKVATIPTIILALISFSLPACRSTQAADEHHEGHQKVVVTSPEMKDVTITQQYVCQIRSQRHIEVCALANGFLMEIPVKEGQAVKAGDVMFRILPPLYRARLESEKAEVQVAEIEYRNTKKLFEQKTPVVSQQEVALYQAKLARAQAKLALAETEMNFTEVKAQFDGIIDHLFKQQGSRIKEEDILTTLSDNVVMWVYFNVPEARYFGFKARQGPSKDISRIELVDSRIELVLADGAKFSEDPGNTVTVEGQFNNKTGNIQFRADFPNRERLLRHGQTGTVLIHRAQKDAMVIPQRATFEILGKRYVWVIGKDGVAHQRLINVANELEDIFVIKTPPTPEEIKQVVDKAKDLRSKDWKVREKSEKEVDFLIGKQYRESVQRAMQVVEGDDKKADAAREVLDHIQGLDVNDKIVLEGVREVHDGEKVEFEFRKPDDAVENQKFRAE